MRMLQVYVAEIVAENVRTFDFLLPRSGQGDAERRPQI
jgi:hypothetical protein